MADYLAEGKQASHVLVKMYIVWVIMAVRVISFRVSVRVADIVALLRLPRKVHLLRPCVFSA